ncbi:MAG: hypothetical protein ACJAT9_001237 [Polaribacter sp.]
MQKTILFGKNKENLNKIIKISSEYPYLYTLKDEYYKMILLGISRYSCTQEFILIKDIV